MRHPAGPATWRKNACTASELLRQNGLESRICSRTDALTFPVQTLAVATALSRQGDRLAALFVVLSGALKLECSGPLGETQVKAFYLPGDGLGLDAIGDCKWHGSATALELSTVAVLPLETMLESTSELREMQCLFHRLVCREIAMRSRALGIVAPPVAEVGLARLLLELGARQASKDRTADVVRLSMSRRDMASHLGIAHETVSRAFTALANNGCIETGRQAVRIVDLQALQRQAARQLGGGEPVDAVSRTEGNLEPSAAAFQQRIRRDRKGTASQRAALGRSLDAPLDPSTWLRTPLL